MDMLDDEFKHNTMDEPHVQEAMATRLVETPHYSTSSIGTSGGSSQGEITAHVQGFILIESSHWDDKSPDGGAKCLIQILTKKFSSFNLKKLEDPEWAIGSLDAQESASNDISEDFVVFDVLATGNSDEIMKMKDPSSMLI
eukprot:1169562_1